MLTLLLIACALQTTLPQSTGATTMPATTRTVDDFAAALDAILRPPPGVAEVMPGLFPAAQFGFWNEQNGIKRPGVGRDSIQIGDRSEFGITIIFFQSPDFKGGEVRYREILTLPTKPQTWGDEDFGDLPIAARPKRAISEDGRTCVTEHTITLKPGQIIPSFVEGESIWILAPFPINVWTLAPGDPPGEWKLEAFINDKSVLTTKFRVNSAP